MKVKSHSKNVDQLIAKVKSASVENKARPATFATIGCLPQFAVTRWGNWLNAALYLLCQVFTRSESDCGKF